MKFYLVKLGIIKLFTVDSAYKPQRDIRPPWHTLPHKTIQTGGSSQNKDGIMPTSDISPQPRGSHRVDL